MSSEAGQRITINSWLEEELYQEFVNNRRAVDESWKQVFEGEVAPPEPNAPPEPPQALETRAFAAPAVALSPPISSYPCAAPPPASPKT